MEVAEDSAGGMAWHASNARNKQGTNAIQVDDRARGRSRENATDLDAVGRVEGGEHLRARRRRRHVEVLRPEHAHGGDADVVAAVACRGSGGASQEGELVGVGVQRGVQEHVDGRLVASVVAWRRRRCGDRERAAGQDVARDGGARELEPPRAAHEADGDPWRGGGAPTGRLAGRHHHRPLQRRWERDGGEAERGGEGEHGGEEEQERRQHGGQAAARPEVVVRRDHRDLAAAAVGLHLRRHGRRFRPAGCCWLVCAWHKRRRRRRRPRYLAIYIYGRKEGSAAAGRRWEGRGYQGGGRKAPRRAKAAPATQHGDGSREGWWWAGGAARVAAPHAGKAVAKQGQGRAWLVRLGVPILPSFLGLDDGSWMARRRWGLRI